MPPKTNTQKIKLSNKSVILVEENHAMPIVSFCAYFQGGVRYEDEHCSGLTNFTQKVLLKGTKKFTAEEFAFRSEAVGSVFVPFTEKDAFGLYTSVLSKHCDEALELFFESLFSPTFPEKEVQKERQNILAEIQESQDEIYSHCLELCDKSLFRSHPYRLPVRGDMNTVQSLKQDDLFRWHHQWYHPNNLILAAIGDFPADRILAKISGYLEKLSKVKLPRYTAPLENGRGKREISVEREKRQLAIALGFLAPSATSQTRFAFEVLNGLLSGMGARLFIELRDKKGLAYSVGSRYDPVLDHGILKTYMGTAAAKEKAAKEGLVEELMRLRETAPESEELERAKRHLIGLYEMGRQKNYVQAIRYARYEMLGLGWRTANLYPKKIGAVAAGDIQKLAIQYLDPENFSCAVIRPTKN